jgi:hypothetical protein
MYDLGSFMDFSLLGFEFGGHHPSRDSNTAARHHATAVATGSVYELRYAETLALDLMAADFSRSINQQNSLRKCESD